MDTTIRVRLRDKILLVIFGIFLSLLILELSLRIGGFLFSSLQEYRNMMSFYKKDTYRIMCIGESTTAVGGKDSYPSQLQEILNIRNIGRKFSLINKGVVATRTGAILLELENNLNKYKPNMVISMMGINDISDDIYHDFFDKIPLRFIRFLHLYKLTRISQSYIKPFIESIKLDPENSTAYMKLGIRYLNLGMYITAENLFKRALKLNPKDDKAYSALGYCYFLQVKNIEAEKAFKKAIKINPKNLFACNGLAIIYKNYYKEPVQAEELFDKAIEIKPLSKEASIAYFGLAQLYLCQNRTIKIERLIKKALELNLNQDKLYGLLATAWIKEGNYELAKEYYQTANRRRLKYYNPITRYNYLQLEKKLHKRGIKLVCVQYPVRSVDSLKAIFTGQDGILFVDNEKIFKDAIRQERYDEYFTDTFGGDFGHCTKKGNRLLAENIANVILKVFIKEEVIKAIDAAH